jgi:D-alanyl-D-alanine carboxypeptidase
MSSASASSVNTSSAATSSDVITLTPELTSDNAVAVYNVDGDQILYSRRGTEKLSPTASTKLLTMMVFMIFSRKRYKI